MDFQLVHKLTSYKYSAITLIFSSFVTGRDIYLVDAFNSSYINIHRLTGVVLVEIGDLIIDISPIRRRFLLDTIEAYRVDILIDYRAASAD